MKYNKIYVIQQLNLTELNDENFHKESGLFYYYAGTNLKDVETKIKTNWSDINETVYPYVALKTIRLNSVGATHDPVRIFKYDKKRDRYDEIAYVNLLIRNEEDCGIKYL